MLVDLRVIHKLTLYDHVQETHGKAKWRFWRSAVKKIHISAWSIIYQEARPWSVQVVCLLQESKFASAVKRVKEGLNKRVVWKLSVWMIIIIVLLAIIILVFIGISLRIGMGLMKLMKNIFEWLLLVCGNSVKVWKLWKSQVSWSTFFETRPQLINIIGRQRQSA